MRKRLYLALWCLWLGGFAAGGRAGEFDLVYPNGVAVDAGGRVYVTDLGSHRIFQVQEDRGLTPVAGDGEGGFAGDGGPAAAARLFAPHDLAFDPEGRLSVADSNNHRIRRIDREGTITTVAGHGRPGPAGGEKPALEAALNNPQGIAFDGEGRLLIADTFNHAIRRVSREGTMTTIVGREAGLAGDGGPAAKAQISLPTAVAVDDAGQIYFCDSGNSRIRRVDREGIITTIAGSGPGSGLAGAGFAGDGGLATQGKLFAPMDLAVAGPGRLVISDSGNNRVRMVQYGTLATIAGTGRAEFNGDVGSALAASFHTPQKLALAPDGSILLADRMNRRVRRITTDGQISTVAGRGTPAAALVLPKD